MHLERQKVVLACTPGRSTGLLLPMLCCTLATCSSQEEYTTLACDQNPVAAGSAHCVAELFYGL